jgi:integrase/recombinase XerD
MTKIRLAYVQEFTDRYGVVRRYFRKAGCKRVLLPGLPGSEEFMAAYQLALAGLPKSRRGPAKEGSIGALIAAYFKDDAFTKALAPETQRSRRNILEHFREKHSDKSVRTLETRHVVAMLGKMKPYAQKNRLKTLRGLMLFAIKENDPTSGFTAVKPPVKSQGHMTWGDEQIAVYRERHPLGTMARLALELVLNVAARRWDVHELGAQHIKHGKLEWRPHKTRRITGKHLSIRILPTLQTALDAMPAGDDSSLAFLRNEYGRPFASADGLGKRFARWCRQAGLKPVECLDGQVRSYRLRGLRKAACKALAHAGCTGPEIMSVSGHSNLAQVQVYIDEFERGRMAEAAIEKVVARK